MKKFKGFPPSETFTPIPDSFFQHLLNEIEDADELKITLIALWRIGSMEGGIHFLKRNAFAESASGLDKAVLRGSLLRVQNKDEEFYFLNSPRGRASAEAMRRGELSPAGRISAPPVARPNVFKLYEENIGPLTPLIADALKDAEDLYKVEWIAEAIDLAVKNNKRNWKYCEAILKRWKEEGRAQKQDRRDNKKTGEQSLDRKIEQLRKRSG
jgi:DnaD/phage-associated family protein